MASYFIVEPIKLFDSLIWLLLDMLEKVYLGINSLICLDYLGEVRLNYFTTVGLNVFFLFYNYSWNFYWSSLKLGTYFTLFFTIESSYLRMMC